MQEPALLLDRIQRHKRWRWQPTLQFGQQLSEGRGGVTEQAEQVGGRAFVQEGAEEVGDGA